MVPWSRRADTSWRVPWAESGTAGGPLQANQCLRFKDFDTPSRVVAVDFGYIQLPHEGDRFVCDDLTRHHDWEARWVRDHEIRRNERGSLFQSGLDFRTP